MPQTLVVLSTNDLSKSDFNRDLHVLCKVSDQPSSLLKNFELFPALPPSYKSRSGSMGRQPPETSLSRSSRIRRLLTFGSSATHTQHLHCFVPVEPPERLSCWTIHVVLRPRVVRERLESTVRLTLCFSSTWIPDSSLEITTTWIC